MEYDIEIKLNGRELTTELGKALKALDLRCDCETIEKMKSNIQNLKLGKSTIGLDDKGRLCPIIVISGVDFVNLYKKCDAIEIRKDEIRQQTTRNVSLSHRTKNELEKAIERESEVAFNLSEIARLLGYTLDLTGSFILSHAPSDIKTVNFYIEKFSSGSISSDDVILLQFFLGDFGFPKDCIQIEKNHLILTDEATAQIAYIRIVGESTL